jgi:hypothetical protein
VATLLQRKEELIVRGIPTFWLVLAVLGLLWLLVTSNAPTNPNTLFYDNFDTAIKGLPDPAWRLPQSASYKAARWIVSEQGTYTIEKAPLGMPLDTFTGSSDWKDYRLDLDVAWASPRLNNAVVIFVRVQDPDNLVGLFYQPGQPIQFKVKRVGEWQDVADQQALLLEAPLTTSVHLTITAQGNLYRAYLNDQLALTATIPDFTSGYIGLETAMADFNGTPVAAQFDNVRILASVVK